MTNTEKQNIKDWTQNTHIVSRRNRMREKAQCWIDSYILTAIALNLYNIYFFEYNVTSSNPMFIKAYQRDVLEFKNRTTNIMFFQYVNNNHFRLAIPINQWVFADKATRDYLSDYEVYYTNTFKKNITKKQIEDNAKQMKLVGDEKKDKHSSSPVLNAISTNHGFENLSNSDITKEPNKKKFKRLKKKTK